MNTFFLPQAAPFNWDRYQSSPSESCYASSAFLLLGSSDPWVSAASLLICFVTKPKMLWFVLLLPLLHSGKISQLFGIPGISSLGSFSPRIHRLLHLLFEKWDRFKLRGSDGASSRSLAEKLHGAKGRSCGDVPSKLLR